MKLRQPKRTSHRGKTIAGALMAAAILVAPLWTQLRKHMQQRHEENRRGAP